MQETEIIVVDKKEARAVLQQVDELLGKVEEATSQAGSCFIDLSFLLLKVKRGAYWTERGCHSEHEYLQKTFPQSRAQYYKLLRCGINLRGYNRVDLKRWGIVKCEGLTRLHIHFEGSVPSEWFEYLEKDSKETFMRRVRGYFDALDAKEQKKVTGKEEKEDPQVEDEFITLRIFGNDINTWNRAMECSGLELGSDKSVSYRVMSIMRDYLAGYTEDGKGRVQGDNAFILASIGNMVKQLNFNDPSVSERLIGIVAKGVEQNVAT
jgi:hypothetical protein